ncbi:ribosome modulation factor [Alkalimarinus coralli]|uniref:ribosome modulation factor n=1 Tax=Alkalimarinus coralli TaxID=2935863 RepID=UPI00202B42D4|nr:ribosome modulation factor [Alkalimarinus coralli]
MAKDFSLGWDLESLNKAYQQGYMAGLMGMNRQKCPYNGEVIAAAWEAGWEDGYDSCKLKEPVHRIA